ncbi:uncharacterized protein [Musca autumnalis]|uniref:uncharacterized protein n=1 Tax=Musca autumnalis TaxID=221902 RepID=UPI003CF42EA1
MLKQRSNMTTVFQGRLCESLKFGHILEISSVAEEQGYWFSISLATDKFNECDDHVDIGLRISIYLQDDLIVFKKRINGEWKQAGSEQFYTPLFLRPFHIIIALDEKKFYISVNNRKLTFIRHNTSDYKELNTLKVTGDLKALKQIDHRRYFPIIWPPINCIDNRLVFSHDLPNSFQPGHVMVVTMKLSGKPDGRFHMHFCNILNSKRQEVHISVRFDTKKIIRTSKLPVFYDDDEIEQLEYGIEEIHGGFPFDRFPTTFKFSFGFTPTSLLLAKDGKFLFDYNFRTPNILPQLSGLKILSLNGMIVQVRDIHHYRMRDPQCEGFNIYSTI